MKPLGEQTALDFLSHQDTAVHYIGIGRFWNQKLKNWISSKKLTPDIPSNSVCFKYANVHSCLFYDNNKHILLVMLFTYNTPC